MDKKREEYDLVTQQQLGVCAGKQVYKINKIRVYINQQLQVNI